MAATRLRGRGPEGQESSCRHGLSEKTHEPPDVRACTHAHTSGWLSAGELGAVSSTSLSLSPAFPKAAVSFFHYSPLNLLFLPSVSPGFRLWALSPHLTLLPLCCLLPTVLGLPVPGHGVCLQMLCLGDECPASESKLARILLQDARELRLWASELTEPHRDHLLRDRGSRSLTGQPGHSPDSPRRKRETGLVGPVFWPSLLSRSFRLRVCRRARPTDATDAATSAGAVLRPSFWGHSPP